MNRKTLAAILFLGGLLALAPLLGIGPRDNAQDFSDQSETARLRRLAGETLRVPLENAEFRSEANLIGLRSKEYLFSRRLDSRTYFAQDLRPARAGDKDFFRGSDAELLERMQQIFKGLEIPSGEIAQARVLQEQLQEGEKNRETGKVVAQDRHPGKRWATAARQVEGLPVFSSRAMLGLGEDGRIDYLELHWPAIPADTLAEAHYLERKAREKYQAPPLAGAHVESVEAGVIHSPAIGFEMDFYPAIRVIYAPDEKAHSKKAVRYLDRNGHDLPIPRQFGTSLEELRGTEKAMRKAEKK